MPENSPLPAAEIPKQHDMWYYTSTLKNTTASANDNEDEDEDDENDEEE